MENVKKYIIPILIFVGLLLCAKLGAVYYDANFNPAAMPSFCSYNDFIDCDGVAKTSFSHFFGIPLFAWGALLYMLFTVMLLSPKLTKFKLLRFLEVFKNPYSYIFSLASLAFVISMSLACISIFVIQKICTLCFATYIVDLLLAIFAKDFSKPLFFEVKQTFDDVKSALSEKKYLITACVLVAAFVATLVYTCVSGIFVPQNESEDLGKIVHEENFVYEDNKLGAKDAQIIINDYIDYNCAGCLMMNTSLRRIVKELDNVLIIQHNFPLDKECNPLIKGAGHPGSCFEARVVLAAGKQGKYWEADKLMFEHTPVKKSDIKRIFSKIKGLDVKKLLEDCESDEIKNELAEQIQEALDKNIDATPTTIINMKKHRGTMPYYDLKQMLIDSGAELRENEQ